MRHMFKICQSPNLKQVYSVLLYSQSIRDVNVSLLVPCVATNSLCTAISTSVLVKYSSVTV